MWYRALFKDFSTGRRVRLGPAVSINVIKGGRLHLADDVFVDANAQLIAQGDIKVGPRGFIGRGSVVVSRESILIGADALIAEYVTIRDQDHGTSESELPYNKQGLPTAPIEIGENVWLGCKVTVLRGVRVGKGCVVGANSLVSRDLPAATVCVGAPAQPIREIGKPSQKKR